MLEFVASLFVGKPLNILAVAVLFVVAYLRQRRRTAPGGRGRGGAILTAAAAWALYGLWELLVQWQTPEANIRVDLLVIWPVLAILSAWAVFRAFK